MSVAKTTVCASYNTTHIALLHSFVHILSSPPAILFHNPFIPPPRICLLRNIYFRSFSRCVHNHFVFAMAMAIRSSAAKMLLGFVLGLFVWADTIAAAPSPTTAPSSATSGGPATTHTVNAGSVRTAQAHLCSKVVDSGRITGRLFFHPEHRSSQRRRYSP